MRPDLTRARELAASAYPEGIRDSMGRVHIPAPRRAIMSGAWDSCPPVVEAQKRLEAEHG